MVTKIEQLDQMPAAQSGDEVVAYHREFYEIPVFPKSPARESPAIPSEILLGYLQDGRLRVHTPIRVKLTAENRHVIAEAVEFNEFGFGDNHSEALIDLQRTVAELYFTLEKEQERLGRDLRDVWANLQQHILIR